MTDKATKYSATIKPRQGDKVMWNWAGGTAAKITGFNGVKLVIEFFTGRHKEHKGRAEVFASSLTIIERAKAKKVTVKNEKGFLTVTP